jgi:phage gp45-like
MHRQTPYDIAFRGYSAGGARSCIDKVDDSKLMQESNDAHGMLGESWPTAEAPQNYGFTSVVADATKSAAGKIQQCAEGFMSFIGGNRNFPVMGMMDDRRHRLKNLAKDATKGATAMFGLKEWGQQFLNTEDGNFLTGNTQKKNRFALVDNQNGQKQQGQQQGSPAGQQKRVWKVINPPGAVELPDGRVVIRSKSGVEFEVELFDADVIEARDAGGGAGGGNSSSSGGNGAAGGGKPTGQKTLHKEDSSVWIEQNKTDTQCVHGDACGRQRASSDSTVFYGKDNSCQATDGHAHIMGDQVHIWVAGACFSDMPIIVKKDGMCKNR